MQQLEMFEYRRDCLFDSKNQIAHYFDDQKGQFQTIKSSELDTGEDYFTARFKDYELGFQLILFEGEKKPRMTMSKYDFKNNKFLEHYACTAVHAYID